MLRGDVKIRALDFIHKFQLTDAPNHAVEKCKLSLIDLIGVAAAGRSTKLSNIICEHVSEEFNGNLKLLFSSRTANPLGLALSAGMTIDSVDAHDGFNPAKGHIGCPLFPAILAVARERQSTGKEFLEALLMGYEFGARASVVQHATVPDYHTSGSWGAVTAAAACSRLMNLSAEQTRHALGIAEYHGPRSQMMRCIDHPTMVKDGSGWGAMTGLSAAKLAEKGFTGAPAITVENEKAFWSDIGKHWYMSEQYYKPYPVCRWAQAPIEGAKKLIAKYGFKSSDIKKIEVDTFHEAVRLATNQPTTTEEAQYSTSFPVAVALARGDVTPQDISDEALNDRAIVKLSKCLVMRESEKANEQFPENRLAKVTIILKNNTSYEGEWIEPKWDTKTPPSEHDILDKFHTLSEPVLSSSDRRNLIEVVKTLEANKCSDLMKLI